MCCTCTCGGLHNRRSIPTRGSITARPQCCNIQKNKNTKQHIILGRRGGCPNLRAFFKMIMMHCNVSRWLKDVESVKNVYFAVAGSEFHVLQWIWNHCINHLSMYIILQISVISTCAFLTKKHVEMNPYRGSRGSDFLCSGRFSEPSCIHVCFAGMNFVFDKGHIAHKGIHDHFKSQVFANKQGWQTIYARRIQRQAWQFVVPAKAASSDWPCGSLRLGRRQPWSRKSSTPYKISFQHLSSRRQVLVLKSFSCLSSGQVWTHSRNGVLLQLALSIVCKQQRDLLMRRIQQCACMRWPSCRWREELLQQSREGQVLQPP